MAKWAFHQAEGRLYGIYGLSSILIFGLGCW